MASKGRTGRKRKEGKRHPNGRIVQARVRDHGCDGVIRRRAMYQRRTYIHDGDGKLVDVKVDDTQTFDAIGRAWSAGLLENDERDATVLRDQGRELYALYWAFYGLGKPEDTLARYSEGRSSSSFESRRARERALDRKLDILNRQGHAVRRAVNALCIDCIETDAGPEFLDRLIAGCATDRDRLTLSLAVKGLVALC